MKKINSLKDIESGMMVTLRNGKNMTVVTCKKFWGAEGETSLALYCNKGDYGEPEYCPLAVFNDDFTYNLDQNCDDHDIVRVWGQTTPSHAFDNTSEGRDVLWSVGLPSGSSKKWSSMTEDEKDAVCDKYEDCKDCPYNLDELSCGDPDEEEAADDDTEDTDDEAALLDEVKKAYENNPIASTLIDIFKDELPPEHVAYICGETEVNPVKAAKEEKVAADDEMSLAEKLYREDERLKAEGLSLRDRDLALMLAMHAACK